MAKGASIKFTTYQETIPELLSLLNVQNELKKYDKIILKPCIKNDTSFTPLEFTENVLKFCLRHKNPVSEIFIAEGSDGHDTSELFESTGYQTLAEKYSIGLIDLNNTEADEVLNDNFMKFEEIMYPRVLLNSCVISLPVLTEDDETDMTDSLTNMLGAYPSQYYAGFFSLKKNKIRKWPMKYSVHDILQCKMPNFAVIDASEHGVILAGLPISIDKQAAKTIGKEWKLIPHLKLVDESFSSLSRNEDKG